MWCARGVRFHSSEMQSCSFDRILWVKKKKVVSRVERIITCEVVDGMSAHSRRTERHPWRKVSHPPFVCHFLKWQTNGGLASFLCVVEVYVINEVWCGVCGWSVVFGVQVVVGGVCHGEREGEITFFSPEMPNPSPQHPK